MQAQADAYNMETTTETCKGKRGECTRTSAIHYMLKLEVYNIRQNAIHSIFFFNSPNPSSRTMALGSTQPLTKMRTRNLPGR
jgi:hypothetical protein